MCDELESRRYQTVRIEQTRYKHKMVHVSTVDAVDFVLCGVWTSVCCFRVEAWLPHYYPVPGTPWTIASNCTNRIVYIKQTRLNKYSCSETVAKLMKLLLKDWLLLIANKTSVPVKFERVLRIFDSPCETTLFTSSVWSTHGSSFSFYFVDDEEVRVDGRCQRFESVVFEIPGGDVNAAATRRAKSQAAHIRFPVVNHKYIILWIQRTKYDNNNDGIRRIW